MDPFLRLPSFRKSWKWYQGFLLLLLKQMELQQLYLLSSSFTTIEVYPIMTTSASENPVKGLFNTACFITTLVTTK